MSQSLEKVLGKKYAMFYHSGMPVSSLTPVQTLDGTIDIVNRSLIETGRSLSQWEFGLQDEITRLFSVNWIYQRLKIESIRKPILAHREQEKFVVDCGDTRLMALSLLTDPPTVGVVVTCLHQQASQYNKWKQLFSNSDLIDCVGFSNNANIFFTPSDHSDYAISWLEIGDDSTSHHPHDITKRLTLMQIYLDQQDTSFQFSKKWSMTDINWTY